MLNCLVLTADRIVQLFFILITLSYILGSYQLPEQQEVTWSCEGI